MEKEKISGIKQQCFSSIDSRADAIFELGRALFAHPELGFKEFETKRLLLEFSDKGRFYGTAGICPDRISDIDRIRTSAYSTDRGDGCNSDAGTSNGEPCRSGGCAQLRTQ